jgi:hypothetical protein
MREFLCQACTSGFDVFADVARHLRKEGAHRSADGGSFACQTCKSVYETTDGLEQHLTKCPMHMRTRAFRHLRTHTAAKSLPLDAKPEGNYKGLRIEKHTLDRLDKGHVDHTLEGKCLCRLCKLVFRSPWDLAIHLVSATSHVQHNTRTTCEDCVHRFDSRRALLDHLRKEPKHMRIRARGITNDENAPNLSDSDFEQTQSTGETKSDQKFGIPI